MNFNPEFISQNDVRYPDLLKEISNPPEGIYVLGGLPEKQKPCIAIVGTRKATGEGKTLAKEIAQKLSRAGAVIVSGLAMGIDTAAHEGALSANGLTIAVLGCGLDNIYPKQNENLAKKILETNGAIISEYPANTPSYPAQFLARNRIVSGLSVATIIIEAPEQSGALVTARLAAEQGREVLVVPGPIKHPNYRGSHQLIRDGARLVSSAEDILEDLSFATKYETIRTHENPAMETIKDENQLLILKTIQEAGQPLGVDKIIGFTKLEPQIINQAISLLIINGLIKETEKGYTI